MSGTSSLAEMEAYLQRMRNETPASSSSSHGSEDDFAPAKSVHEKENVHNVPSASSTPSVGHASQPAPTEPNALAHMLAQKIYENEKREREERKRKREEEEAWQRQVNNVRLQETKRLDEEERLSSQANRELYAMFNDLQGISNAFNISFDAPELVVVGMQSDGKSTFIEGLLGFQFNIVESTIGTRRPLILQMINDPSRTEPHCRFRKEYLAGPDEDPLEADNVPPSRLCAELQRRTNMVAGRGDAVSSSPIILRVEYAHCANLTIFDTPGFRLGGDEKLKTEILDMVKRIMEPKNRIIICLEQSTVEWANTTSRPIVREIDRDLSRTVLVNTKFDNRVKELRSKEAAEKYLQGEGLPAGRKAFFVSMPIRRGLDSESFMKAIRSTYMDDFARLYEVKCDERFLSQLGFHRTKSYLERLLSEKYTAAVAPTLQILEEACRKAETELASVRRELQSNDLESLKMRVSKYVQAFTQLSERLLSGSMIGDPDTFGQTLSQERHASGVAQWPGPELDVRFINDDLRLYGGAQYERLLHEFECIARETRFPPISINEVAAALGPSKSHNIPIYETAASDIVQIKSRRVLEPMIHIVLQRAAYVFERMFDIAVHVLRLEPDSEYGMLGCYELFQNELRQVFRGFVRETESKCKEKLKDDFDTFTKVIDWDLINGLHELCTDTTIPDVASSPASSSSSLDPSGGRRRGVDEAVHKRVCALAARLFAGIRFFFVKYIKNKLNAFFLDPMFQRLGSEVSAHFRRLPDARYEQIFQLGITELRQRLAHLEVQHAHCIAQRDKFKEAYMKLKRAVVPKTV